MAVMTNPRVWLLAWAVGGLLAGLWMWQSAQRPANRVANEVTLEPLIGTYGPVQVKVLEGAGSADRAGVGLVLATHVVLLVKLPDLTIQAAPTPGRPASEAVRYDEVALARQLAPGRAPTEAKAAEFRELAGVFDTPTTGVRTDVRHFGLTAANPWDRPWWLRRPSRSVVDWIVLWLLGGGAIWVWAARGDARVRVRWGRARAPGS